MHGDQTEKRREGSGSPSHFIVHLVHGTFARKAKWIQEGSPLRVHLEKTLPGTVEFEPLEWSGKNRNRDRKAAAQRLAGRIEQQASGRPPPLQFVVGHSHGGNVALYALARPSIERATTGVVCFNTPFIATLRRNTQQLSLVVVELFGFLLLAGVVAGLSAVQQAWGTVVLMVGVLLATAALLGTLAAIAEAASRTDKWLQRRREETIETVSLPTVEQVPVLCLWAAGDEVQGFLGLLEALANLPFLLLHVFSVAALFVITWVLHFTGTIDRIVTLDLSPSTNLDIGNGASNAVSAALYVTLGVLALVGAALVMNLFLRLVPIGLPALSFASSIFVRLRFTVVPLSARRTEYRDAALPLSFLNHSSAYRNPTMHEAVSDWMISIAREHRVLPSPRLSNP